MEEAMRENMSRVKQRCELLLAIKIEQLVEENQGRQSAACRTC